MQANTQSNNIITYSLPEVIEHSANHVQVSTALLESLTSRTVDDCLKDLRSSVNLYFMRKKEQLPELVKSLLYTVNRQPMSSVQLFFNETELMDLQKEVLQKVRQRMAVFGETVTSGFKWEMMTVFLNLPIKYLTELVNELRLTLKTFYLYKKLGEKGLGMVTEQVKSCGIKLFSSYLEQTCFESEQVVSRCEEKLKLCLLGLVSDLEEQVTDQLTGPLVEQIYNWYDEYVGNLT